MKTKFACLGAAVLALALCLQPAQRVQAQEKEPTLQESLQWLREKLDGLQGGSNTIRVVRLDNEVFEWTVDLPAQQFLAGTRLDTAVRLRDLDPARIGVANRIYVGINYGESTDGDVVVFSKGNDIHQTGYGFRIKNGEEVSQTPVDRMQQSAPIPINNPSLAGRVAKALQQIARLSAGPKEPY